MWVKSHHWNYSGARWSHVGQPWPNLSLNSVLCWQFFLGGEEEFIIVMSSPGLLNPRWPWRHFGMRKYFVTHSNARPAQNAKAILKTYELFIYRDVHYIPHSFCKGCWNSDTVAHCICSEILILLSECIFTLHHASKNTQVKLYVYLLIFNYL